MAEQGADLRGKSGLCRVSEVCKPELWVTRWFPKPSPKRDRAITKATAVSPLSRLSSQSCALSARLSGTFGYFCFPDKSDSPISLQSKRGETAFSGFCASKTVLFHPNAVLTIPVVGYSLFPKSSLKRDRAITKATAVSPLSPIANQSCAPASCLVQPTKSQIRNCGLLHRITKPSLKRDRVITKATAVRSEERRVGKEHSGGR